MNGADIFRAAVGLTLTDTWWRVDWNTLAGPRIPIAEWALDTDDEPTTGLAAWPAGAGLRSAGVDRAIDELVPVSSVLDQINYFDALGERYRFELYPAEDHLVYATQDGFSSAATHMGEAVRQKDPGHVSFSWYPHLVRPDLGIGPASTCWVEGLSGRQASPGMLASMDANSHARPDPAATIELTRGVLVPGDPSSAAVSELDWRLGSAPPPRAQLDLTLTDVGALTLSLQDAGFAPRRHGSVATTADGSADLSLAQLAPGTPVRLDGRTLALATGDGEAQVLVAAGRHAVDFG
ncbi:MAG TPA: hypothetical protein VGL48_10875 [Acidimicrobiales bacterium]|jgi:hypothetical protein